ncbi:hypothetical protein CAPTEDRAFT_23351, partial [Capitella teleta]
RLVDTDGDFSHIVQRKTRMQLVLLSAAVCGIEFCYAAETAFVSPILLKIGVPVVYMTLVWCLSPVLGFFLVPVFGSISDRCSSKFGRRRPFIVMLSIGIIIGLILVPNGERFGRLLGDVYATPSNTTSGFDDATNITTNVTTPPPPTMAPWIQRPHPLSILFTVIGVVLLDFSCDACQSPCRTYLLDVSTPEDHAVGLGTFTVMAGFGGSLGYIMGGINWSSTTFGESLGGHVKVVFTLVLLIHIVCVVMTITAIKEVPLDKLGVGEAHLQHKKVKHDNKKYRRFSNEEDDDEVPDYGAVKTEQNVSDTPHLPLPSEVSLKHYLKTIIHMPRALRILCVTNLFCWMSLVCYSLYFTDFVGQAVFGGSPSAAPGTEQHALYEEGVRIGSLAMSLYSASCSCYSLSLEKLISRFGARPVYVISQLIYTFGATMMVFLPRPVAVFVLSPCAGVMYATLFTMPYLLVAHYHSSQHFGDDDESESQSNMVSEVRGLGTDVAVVSSMVFVAQFLLSSCMGSIVQSLGTTKAVMGAAAMLSACGALCATKVVYLGL